MFDNNRRTQLNAGGVEMSKKRVLLVAEPSTTADPDP